MTERIRRHDLRVLLLDAGKELLLAEGLVCGLDRITFPRVFEIIESQTGRRITRASVYDRIWRSQAEFQWEVLAELLEERGGVADATQAIVAEVLSTADRTTDQGRWDCLSELCLIAVERHVHELSEMQVQRIALAAIGAVASSPADPTTESFVVRVQDTLHRYLLRETDSFLDLYLTIGSFLGFRLRDPLELRHLVLAIGALAEGVALRMTFFPEYGEAIAVPRSDDAQLTGRWTLASVGVIALARHMLEIDPDWYPDREVFRAESSTSPPA